MLQEKFRQNATQYYQKHGLPSRKNEAWHYTSMKDFDVDSFVSPKKGNAPIATGNFLESNLPPDCLKLVFIDGYLSTEFSQLKELKKYLSVETQLSSALIQNSIKQRASVGTVEQDVFEALNAARTQSLLGLTLKANTSLKKPLLIVSLATTDKVFTAPKVVLSLGQGSKLTLMESYLGHAKNYFQNSMVEAHLGESSKLEYIRLQEEGASATNIGRSRFFVDQFAALECLTVGLGAQLARHNLEIYVKGEQATAASYGLYLVSGDQHHDHHLLIDHVVGHCSTQQHYKGVLDGRSKAIFDGLVRIRKDSQKASSAQLNNNLVLSQTAEADSKPQLQISADDVTATHGSTVGQLLDEELFYFQSRGISKTQAEEMLSLGFLEELVFKVSHPQLRSWLQTRVQKSYQKMRNK